MNLSFNQDHGCFSCSLDNGVRIYNLEPLKEKTHLDAATVGSVTICEMLNRTNLLAIVGGGRKQKFAENVVLLWDDLAQRFVSEYTFSTPVLSLQLRKDRLYVAQETQIHVFRFPNDPAKLHTFDTGENPKGLFGVSPFPSSERQILTFPSHHPGHVQIVDLSKISQGTSAAPITIAAHSSKLAYIALNSQGTMLATASVKGTLIRVFDTFKKTQLIELRRGVDYAMVYCINFSHDSEFLVISSDKGTVHIFALKDAHLNKRFALPGTLFGLTPLYSMAQFTIPAECKCQCAFVKKTISVNSVVAICEDGTLYKKAFTSKGNFHGDTYDMFLNLCEDDEY
ncbi:hypothetical protein JTE90_029565 [Oedothorax gibbosus]|uniref:WD repeat domain phosphoinositide-interacting protein 4 n=1 Tax=Oedothorax gibbosus TaxID=931172 RepID=A0AAV6VDN8_9ARAC|nr:hypothetical protein JTE90_029565 [Oedothorax gibbosus]